MKDLFQFDNSFKSEYKWIAGVDEVGRGPLAGPVVCAAVILPENPTFSFLDDSKKLTEKRREIAYDEIIEQALFYSIVEIDHTVIDSINILNATKKGMVNAIHSLEQQPDFVLIDGNQRIDIDIPQETVIKGDSKSAAIAAASIIAKVYRDRLMTDFAVEFPHYKFESNKGYGSKAHRDGIKAHGSCRIHRKSFLKNIEKEIEQLRLL